ncbi:MAG: hypothetical protein S4CHLAM123_08470 [Chlamydiales bacterium]|nr:hypothetical protein [Chlamydiales bacterium]
MRAIIIFIGILLLCAGVALMGGVWTPWYTSFLLGATVFCYAFAALWIGVTKSYRALVGGGVSLLLTFGGCAIYSLRVGEVWYGQIFLYLAIVTLWIFFFALNLPKKKQEPLPASARLLFGIVMTLALLEGVYLIIPLPARFAWLLNPDQAVIYGWMLIGGSLFFGWALFRPVWENGYPALYSLFAYNLLLIGPALRLVKQPSSVAVIPFYLAMLILVVLVTGVWSGAILYKRLISRKI